MSRKVAFITAMLLLFFMSVQVYGQIQFTETLHDFGTFNEGENLTHTFKFKNASFQPVKLYNVKASCGCTAPRWSETAIKPGETGTVDVTYNSYNRPGPFEKTVSVVYDTTKSPVILTIKGVVTPKQDGLPLDSKAASNIFYIDTVGALAFERVHEPAGELKSDQTRDMAFNCKNISKKTITFLDKTEGADKACWQIRPLVKTLKPGQESAIVIKFIAEKGASDCKYNHGDAIEEEFVVYTDEPEYGGKTLTVSGTFMRVFSADELAKQPKAHFIVTDYNGGEVIQGQKLNYAFKITNTGGSDLEIRSAKASCGCTASAPKDKLLRPGATSEIQVSFDSAGRIGEQHKTVTVVTNDPKNPNTVLHLRCVVKDDPFGGGNGSMPLNDSQDDHHGHDH